MTKFSLKPSLGALLLAAGLGLCFSSGYTIAKSSSLDSGQAIFEVLASEIALQRGEAGLAYNTYLELARQLDDPRLAH